MKTQRRLHRSSIWLGVMLVAIIASAAMVAFAAQPKAAPTIVWNDAASRDLEATYHRLHDKWNEMDINGLKAMFIGDDRLATFDNDPVTDAPVKLQTKADMDRFTDEIFDGFKKSNVKSLAQHPMIACRVSGALGVCTEECRVQLIKPDGTKQVVRLRGSAVAVNDHGAWKFIQWHMSPGGPVESYDRSGNRVTSASTDASSR